MKHILKSKKDIELLKEMIGTRDKHIFSLESYLEDIETENKILKQRIKCLEKEIEDVRRNELHKDYKHYKLKERIIELGLNHHFKGLDI